MSNPLTTAPIPQSIKKIAIPASIGFLFNTLFNITDTFYAKYLGDEAIAALTYAFPLFFILIAFGSGFGQGASTVIANLLGAGEERQAFKAAKQTVILTVLFGIMIAIAGPLMTSWLLELFGEITPTAEALTIDYITPIFYMGIFFVLPMMFNNILMAQGNSKPFRDVMTFGFFLNLLLNPLLMNGWGAIPALGIVGIAWATIIIEMLATVYTAYHLLKSPLFSQIPERENRSINYYFEIIKQGLAPAFNLVLISVGFFILANTLGKYGEDAVTGYGIGSRLTQFFFLPVIGINMAVVTLIGQNYGAKKIERVKEIYKISLKYAFLVSAFGGIAIALLASTLTQFFSENPLVLEYAAQSMLFEALAFFGYAMVFISIAVWQGIKKPQIGFWANILRQVIMPYAIFVYLFGIINPPIEYVWIALILMNSVIGGVLCYVTFQKIKTLES